MQIIKKIWRPLLSLVLLAALVAKGPFNLEQLKTVLSHTGVLVLGFIIVFLQVIFFTLRWKLFVDLVTKSTFYNIFKLNLVGMFFNFFIPGGVGGDIVKAIELSKEKTSTRSEALSTVLSDRVFGLYAMISFSTFFLVYEYFIEPTESITRFATVSLLAWLGMTVALLFLPFIFNQLSGYLNQKDSRLLMKIEKFISSLNFTFLTFRKTKIQLQSLFISLASQLTAICFLYYVVLQLNVALPSFLVFFSLCCFGFVAAALPIMPGGIGVGQYAFYVLFSPMSAELGQATITAITTLQFFQLLYALIGGLIFSLNPQIERPQK